MAEELPETCHFGHVFRVYDEDYQGPSIEFGGEKDDVAAGALGETGAELRDEIRKGNIKDLDELASHEDYGTYLLRNIMGDAYKHLNVASDTQGIPYLVSFICADKLNEDNNYEVAKTEEKTYVSPQSNVHGEMMQRKQQAEQNIKQTMQSYQQLKKQKHMLEHDIRKLRSRAEDFETGDETQLKGDFIELVDGAGAAGQQGGDEASLKFYRDQNIYPSIVADFNEMRSLEDLKDPDNSEFDNPRLNDVPENEKAILKKKYTMYEKWKDLYGSEINRKLDELKSELRRIERSIEETEDWLAPYVRDMQMIQQKDTGEVGGDLAKYWSVKGTSTMDRQMEFICYRPLKNEGGEVKVVKDNSEEEATHYRVIYIYSFHLSLPTPQQPQSPAEGPSATHVWWFPAIVCRHVFENFFQAKIQKSAEEFEELMEDYTGEFEPTDEGKQVRDARQDKNMSVRELRGKIADEVDGEPPIELSSYIRRLEDGLDDLDTIRDRFEDGDDYADALLEVLEIEMEEEEEEGDEMYTGVTRKLREFTGQTDPYVIPNDATPLEDLLMEMKFKYYYDFKLDFGLHTMN